MKLSELVQQLHLSYLTPELPLDPALDVSAGHVSDLLSDVLAHAPSGGVLVTVLVNMNVIAVALHADVVAVIFAGGMKPDETVITRATLERLPLFSAEQSAFEVVGQLYACGVHGQ